MSFWIMVFIVCNGPRCDILKSKAFVFSKRSECVEVASTYFIVPTCVKVKEDELND
jgi:hypothetical protein